MGKREQNAPRESVKLSGIADKKIRREAFEVATRAFTDPGRMERHLSRALWRGSVFDPEHTRVVVAQGRVVSLVVMGPRLMRFGPVTVPAMTLGPVGTHDQYRKRGYAAAAMNDASAYMEQNGFLLAYLQGIEDFYYRFGYYPFMAPASVKFSREGAKKQTRPGRLRRLRRDDLPAVRKIYDEVTASRMCSSARDDQVWHWLVEAGSKSHMFPCPQVVLDGTGTTCGYLTMAPEGELGVSEIVVRQDEASCRAVLGALVREARRRESKEITLPLPWDEALTVFLRQYVGAECKMHGNATGGAVMKIVDFPILMRRLAPLFTRRWQRSGRASAKLRFTLSSEIGSVGFTFTQRAVHVGGPVGGARVHIPQRWLSGLITGYYALKDVALQSGAAVPAKLAPVLETLFPPGWPFVYQGDNY